MITYWFVIKLTCYNVRWEGGKESHLKKVYAYYCIKLENLMESSRCPPKLKRLLHPSMVMPSEIAIYTLRLKTLVAIWLQLLSDS